MRLQTLRAASGSRVVVAHAKKAAVVENGGFCLAVGGGAYVDSPRRMRSSSSAMSKMAPTVIAESARLKAGKWLPAQ